MLRAFTLLLLMISMLLVACDNSDDDASNDTSDDTQQDEASPTASPDGPLPATDTTIDAEDTPVPQTETVWIVGGNEPVDVYDCPETTCDVVDTLFPGTALDVVSTEDNWHEIIIDDTQTAYIEVAMTQEETRLVPPENSSLPPGVTPSDGTAAVDGPPPLSAPPGQPTSNGTSSFSTDNTPSDSSLPPGVPTQDGTTQPNFNNDGPPNVTSEPPPGVSD